MSIGLRQLLLFVHLLAAMAWVGGMFFAYFCLRPAAAETLDPPKRLPLWAATFERFLRITAVAVVALLGSGLLMMQATGFGQAPPGWHVMMTLGLVMSVVFVVLYALHYPRFRRHCAASEWPAAAGVLNTMRRLVAVNLVLAVCTVAAAVFAR